MSVQYDPESIQSTGLKDLERSSFTKDDDGNTARRVIVTNNCIVISFSPRGVYSALTEYKAGDVVSYLGSSYVAMETVTGVAPTDVGSWLQIAQKGADGVDGIDGVDGLNGADGDPGENCDGGNASSVYGGRTAMDGGNASSF